MPDPDRSHRVDYVLLIVLLVAYVTISLRHLTVVPPVYEDEPWQASTGWKLAQDGVLGSDLFVGLAGMERRTYVFPPLHPILLALTYRLVGLGLLQTRLEPVTMGLLTILLTFAVGRDLFGTRVGLAAVALLLVTRTAGATPSQLTGIVLLDTARIARYDMIVPVFGLAAFLAYRAAARNGGVWRFTSAGLLAGLAGLAHLYGAFWVAVLLVLAVWERRERGEVLALATGALVPWLAVLAYVLTDLADFLAQTRGYAPRFGLTHPAWYWHNLTTEYHRYGPGLGSLGPAWLRRPGFWAAASGVPATLAALAHRTIRRADPSARALLVPLVVLPGLLALLVTLKLSNYLVTLAPVTALALAWGMAETWRWAGSAGKGAVRVVLLVAVAAIITEGASRVVVLERAAAQTTAYAAFMQRIRACLPPGARVLGPHRYWLGLSDRDFVSWAVPLLQAGPGTPLRSFVRSLDTIDPDVVLIDRGLSVGLAAQPGRVAVLHDWFRRRAFGGAEVIDDRTYGRMEIFVRRRKREQQDTCSRFSQRGD
ncbi:MAG: hypothetical protein ACM3O7_08765 [Acidobacteriota bacterium]